MKKGHTDLIIGIAVAAVGLFIFFYSFNYSRFNREGTLPVGPRFYPQMIGICLTVCGIILSIRNRPFQIVIPREGFRKNAKVILSFVLYVILFETLGYILSTLLFIFALVYLQERRKLLELIMFTIVVTFSLYFTFHTFLSIPLPGGFLKYLRF